MPSTDIIKLPLWLLSAEGTPRVASDLKDRNFGELCKKFFKTEGIFHGITCGVVVEINENILSLSGP